mmetsp:Transcript_94632/g.187496  ORF Transcript_94632/g.187496 Transcript_94632/m.187496 type:complete len:384 (+) Transcript_94632:59-1210(+)
MGNGTAGKPRRYQTKVDVKEAHEAPDPGKLVETPREEVNADALLSSLNHASVLDMVQTAEGKRRFCIGSIADPSRTSFVNKAMQRIGDDMSLVQGGLGYTCRKGLKPESPNQDGWFIVAVEQAFSVYGVFDGHGQKGHDISNFVSEALPKLIVADRRFLAESKHELLRDSFRRMQFLIGAQDKLQRLSAQLSGTTATVAVHDHLAKKLTLAHVADSTAVLGRYRQGKKQELEAIVLTRDHKPGLQDERARIERSGGRVVFDGYANYRVYAKNARWPGLKLSRCLGDLKSHLGCGVIAEPEVTELQIAPNDHVVLLCSDGVWEFIRPDEAVRLVSEYSPSQAMVAAERLAKEAWDRWILEESSSVVDDITVLLVYLHAGRDEGS